MWALLERRGNALRCSQGSGVHTEGTKSLSGASGHAVIQVDQNGQNNIIICGGANDSVSKGMIDEAVKEVEEGDIVLLQNEISNVGYAAETAKKAGAKVALNPSPINENLKTIPMNLVDYFILNEIEGKEISGAESEEPEEIMEKLKAKYPDATFVLTLGEKGPGILIRLGASNRIFIKLRQWIPLRREIPSVDISCPESQKEERFRRF